MLLTELPIPSGKLRGCGILDSAVTAAFFIGIAYMHCAFSKALLFNMFKRTGVYYKCMSLCD